MLEPLDGRTSPLICDILHLQHERAFVNTYVDSAVWIVWEHEFAIHSILGKFDFDAKFANSEQWASSKCKRRFIWKIYYQIQKHLEVRLTEKFTENNKNNRDSKDDTFIITVIINLSQLNQSVYFVE